jgi:DNA-binding LytR/AlgR family response regulator
MKLRCAIVDDEPLAITVLEGFLAKLSNIEVVATFNDALSVIDFLSENQVDFLFLDIEMPNLTGIDFLKTLSNPPLVVITSANKNYATDAFDLSVVDYIVKPLTLERILKATNKVSEKISAKPNYVDLKENNSFIFLKENKRMVKVNLDEILFVESVKDYVKVVCRGKTVITKQNISGIEQVLNPLDFIRVHKSFIVSFKNVDAFSSSEIEIGLFKVPIGRSYKDNALNRLGDICDTL